MARWWRGGWNGSATRCGRGGGWRELNLPGGSSPPRGHPRRSSPSRRGKLILRSLLVCQVVSGHVITIVAITRLVILNVNSRLLKTCIGQYYSSNKILNLSFFRLNNYPTRRAVRGSSSGDSGLGAEPATPPAQPEGVAPPSNPPPQPDEPAPQDQDAPQDAPPPEAEPTSPASPPRQNPASEAVAPTPIPLEAEGPWPRHDPRRRRWEGGILVVR